MATFTTIDEVAGFLASSHHRAIGIAGAPGAGKSTIAAELVKRLPSAALLPMDGFHYPQHRLVELGRRDRMGAPDTFDVPAFIALLSRWSRSSPRPNEAEPLIAPGFDREIEEPVAEAISISPSCGQLVVEGNYLLLDSGGWEQAAPLLDVTFFVQIDDDVRRERLIERHIRFGKSAPDARAWALGPDEANAALIAATASRADHVIALK